MIERIRSIDSSLPEKVKLDIPNEEIGEYKGISNDLRES
jgi:hypothetical protein